MGKLITIVEKGKLVDVLHLWLNATHKLIITHKLINQEHAQLTSTCELPYYVNINATHAWQIILYHPKQNEENVYNVHLQDLKGLRFSSIRRVGNSTYLPLTY
jgi:hypothetical protein